MLAIVVPATLVIAASVLRVLLRRSWVPAAILVPRVLVVLTWVLTILMAGAGTTEAARMFVLVWHSSSPFTVG